MKRLIFQVSVGKPSKLYTTCIKSVAEYCKKYGIDHIVLTEPKLRIRPDMKRTGRSKEAVEKLGYMPIYEKENQYPPSSPSCAKSKHEALRQAQGIHERDQE